MNDDPHPTDHASRPDNAPRGGTRGGPVSWPAIASALAALLGMGSCALTVVPLTGFMNAPWLAPLIGIVTAGGAFRLLLPLGASSRATEGQRAELRLATIAAWVTSVVVGLVVAWQVNRAFRKPEAELDVYLGGLIVGSLVGAVFARIVHVIGSRYFHQRRAPHPAAPPPV